MNLILISKNRVGQLYKYPYFHLHKKNNDLFP